MQQFEQGVVARSDARLPDMRMVAGSSSIHVIFSWAQIGRSAIFGREIGVPDREIFSRQTVRGISDIGYFENMQE